MAKLVDPQKPLDPQQSSRQHSGPISGPILLAQAAEGFLNELAGQAQYPKQGRFRALVVSLEQYLGPAAPLLAYTKLTGEAWRSTLGAAEQAEAQRFLDEFREYLRSFGWFDAARPVNQFD